MSSRRLVSEEEIRELEEQFRKPMMECRECGKPVHEGACYPLTLERLGLICLAGLFIYVILGLAGYGAWCLLTRAK